jgi:hypothetical protein
MKTSLQDSMRTDMSMLSIPAKLNLSCHYRLQEPTALEVLAYEPLVKSSLARASFCTIG